MVMFASLVGAAAVYARVVSASPTDYGSAAGYGYGAAPAASSSTSMSMSMSMSSAMAMATSMSMSSAMAMATSMSMASPPPAYSSSSSSYGSGSSSYGSGSSSMGSGGYDSCVQQCVAQFGAPSTAYMSPPMSSSSAYSGSSGSGATHTVWVAPTQGVLRYVPFALNASVGDTVKFIWGANNHTVTKSSELDLCNKTTNVPFASGEQNKTFVFTQVVNDTNPTFYYCGTPTHCQKGMFGIINPPNAWGQPSCASSMMPAIASQNPSSQAAVSYMNNATSSSPAAASWGNGIDMKSMPQWAQSYAVENIAYTKSFLAMNPETISQSGAIDFSPLANNAIMMPTDVAAAVRASGSGSNMTSSASASSSSASSTSAPAQNGSKNGAGALSSPRVAVALVAVAAACFAL